MLEWRRPVRRTKNEGNGERRVSHPLRVESSFRSGTSTNPPTWLCVANRMAKSRYRSKCLPDTFRYDFWWSKASLADISAGEPLLHGVDDRDPKVPEQCKLAGRERAVPACQPAPTW